MQLLRRLHRFYHRALSGSEVADGLIRGCLRGMLHCSRHVDTLLDVRCTGVCSWKCSLPRLAVRLPRNTQLNLSHPFSRAPNRKAVQSTNACLQTAPTRQPAKPQKSCSYDVIVLGNLCLDIFVSVPTLPSREESSQRKLLQELTAFPPDRTAWEVGGNTNFMIAAARLGMQVAPIGHLGPDEYGQFIKDVLQVQSQHLCKTSPSKSGF